MAGFDSLVQVCRLADTRQIAGTDLILALTKSPEFPPLCDAIEAAGWRVSVAVDGHDVTTSPEKIPDGQPIVASVHGMTRTKEVFVNGIDALLSYDGGSFLGAMPASFYLLNENYAGGEEPVHESVARYQRVLRLIEFVRQIADDVRSSPGTAGEAVFLTTRKLAIPLTYKHWDLKHVPATEKLDIAMSDVLNDHHGDARKDIARRAVVRMLAGTSAEERFSAFIRMFGSFHETFLADFDIYASSFNLDKAREDFERKRLDYVVKLNSVGSDALGKLIAIPVGQGLLASQMKVEQTAATANLALLVASYIFAAIAMMIITSYVLSILQVADELKSEANVLKDKSQPTYVKLKPMIDRLGVRIAVYELAVPIILGLLLFVTTYVTTLAYRAVAT